MKPQLLLLCLLTLNAAAQTPKPFQLPAGIKMEKDIAYIEGGDEAQKLDIYLPEAPPAKPLPLIVHIHGGGWRAGSKFPCPVAGMVLKGYAVASVEYRFSHKAVFPAQIQDCQAAFGSAALVSASSSVRAASAITTGIRPSIPLTGVGRPSSTAVTNPRISLAKLSV